MKQLTHWATALITLSIISFIGWSDPFVKETLRLKSFDLIQQYDTPQISSDIAILEIDEKSIGLIIFVDIFFSSLYDKSGIDDAKCVEQAHKLYESLGTVLSSCLANRKVSEDSLRDILVGVYKGFGGGFLLPSFEGHVMKSLD